MCDVSQQFYIINLPLIGSFTSLCVGGSTNRTLVGSGDISYSVVASTLAGVFMFVQLQLSQQNVVSTDRVAKSCNRCRCRHETRQLCRLVGPKCRTISKIAGYDVILSD